MRVKEIIGGPSVYLNNEEATLLDRFSEDTPMIFKRDLDEHKVFIADQLVNKGLLKRLKSEDGKLYYKKPKRVR